jgi:hypothetical protein
MIASMKNKGDAAVIGWAFDGYPILGNNEADGTAIAAGSLGVCNGKMDSKFGYAYHTSDTHPYILQCLVGDYDKTLFPRVEPLSSKPPGEKPQGGVTGLKYTEQADGSRHDLCKSGEQLLRQIQDWFESRVLHIRSKNLHDGWSRDNGGVLSQMKKIIRLLLNSIFVFGALLGTAARAHEMSEATATITVRDQAVEVRLNVDLLNWLKNIPPVSKHISDPVEGMARLMKADESLSKAYLLADGEPLKLRTVQSADIKAVVAALKEHEQGKHTRAIVLMQATLPRARIKNLKLRLPIELGAVETTLNRPVSQFVQRGGVASFNF